MKRRDTKCHEVLVDVKYEVSKIVAFYLLEVKLPVIICTQVLKYLEDPNAMWYVVFYRQCFLSLRRHNQVPDRR